MYVPAYAEGVPSWIKTIAGFWSDDLISDDEFLGAMEYLIQNNYITIPHNDAQTATDQIDIMTNIVPRVEMTTIEIVPTMPAIYDILLEDPTYKIEPDVTVNHVWIAKELHNLDDVKKIQRMSSFMESIEDGFEAGYTDEKKAVHIELFLNNDKDMSRYLDYISMDELIRYNDRHVGQDALFEVLIVEVVDLPGDDLYEILAYVEKINFENTAKEGDVFRNLVVAEYAGPRMRDGDSILVRGTISGLEIREIDHLDVVVKLKSSGRYIDNADKPIAGDKNQVEIPIITASHIHVLTDPYDLDLWELEDISLNIPYRQFEENKEIMSGMIVYYQGVVASVVPDQNDVESFNIDVSKESSTYQAITVLRGDERIDISRYDTVGVYGLVKNETGNYPVMYALHITSP